LPSTSKRLLGFAFAGADLLMEVSPDGVIAFTLGASKTLSGAAEAKLTGRKWRDFVDPRDRPMVEALFDGLDEGTRAGPICVSLAEAGDGVARAASLSAFRLPDNYGAVSCTLSHCAQPQRGEGPGGLFDKSSFEAITARLFENDRNGDLELSLIEMAGFAAAQRAMTPDQAQDAMQRLGGLLRAQSANGGAAADLGGDRFAMVRRKGGEEAPDLAARLLTLMKLEPNHQIKVGGAAMALASDASANQVLRAIRYSLDAFIRDGVENGGVLSLGEAVTQSVRRTAIEVGALSDAVSERNFRLAYQPVVDLKNNGALHHHEVLVRFGDTGSPFPIIRMAEELDLIEPLDLAIVERTIAMLREDPKRVLAVNISGRTIGSGNFIDSVQRMLSSRPEIHGRLIFELTESAAIDDLPLADRHLQVLRREGCQVCLDDFGAGAASLAYLQQLSLDVVKIDGSYIRELQHGGRESAFIRQLVRMCSELGVKTLAEMVETPQVEDAVRRAGVDYAQGWLYGPAVDLPGPPLTDKTNARPAPRRMGAVEGWG
jgi:EAL domain-containing protein (putative c-di-GMP-specific phosphodiesterase class I)/GGDEF domain-containing protein